MLRNVSSNRYRTNLQRVPPWRKWVGVRDKVPLVAFSRNTQLSSLINYPEMESSVFENGNLLITAPTEQVLAVCVVDNELSVISDTVNHLTMIVPQFRKFLVGPLRDQAVNYLDAYCGDLMDVLPVMSQSDKVKLLCSFGQLIDYSVVNRVANRYNSKKLMYQNSDFFKKLVNSIHFKYANLIIVRTIARMDIPRSLFASKFDTFVVETRSPAKLTELVLIACKNRIMHPQLFTAVVSEIDTNFNAFTQDYIGDIARGFTVVPGAHIRELVHILDRELPTRVHELAWWNLVDILDFFRVHAPKDFVPVCTRMCNEIWRHIPDMRSGYCAKTLNILSEMNLGDKRTRRSLIRNIPKNLNKLHAKNCAQCIVSAANIGYLPKNRYGRKKFGSLFYKRVATRLINSDDFHKISPELILKLLRALAQIDRPNSELFDKIIAHSVETKNYTNDQLVEMNRIFAHFGKTANFSQNLINDTSTLNIENQVYLAIDNPTLLDNLLLNKQHALIGVSAKSLTLLLQNHPLHDNLMNFTVNEWILCNLANISEDEVKRVLEALAIVPNPPVCTNETINLVEQKILTKTILAASNPEELLHVICSLFILSKYDEICSMDKILNQITNQPINSLYCVQLAQLIAGHIRLSSSVSDSANKFCKWIESHLVSKTPNQTATKHWHSPPGSITDLDVFPISIPLALPDPRIDLLKLHVASNTTQIRRAINVSHAGIALFPDYGERKDLLTVLREDYLTKLGWNVKYTQPEDDVSNPTTISNIFLDIPLQQSSITISV